MGGKTKKGIIGDWMRKGWRYNSGSCCCSLPWSTPSKQTVGPSTPDDFSAKHRPAELLEFSTKEFPNGSSSVTTESLRLLQAGSNGEEKY